MMQYTRSGIYVERKKASKKTGLKQEKPVDWINIFLFVLLFVVVFLFIFT